MPLCVKGVSSIVKWFLFVRDFVPLPTSSDSTHDRPISHVSSLGNGLSCMMCFCELSHDDVAVVIRQVVTHLINECMVAELDVLLGFWYDDGSFRDVKVGSEACAT